MTPELPPAKHIRLTSHPVEGRDGAIPIDPMGPFPAWGDPDKIVSMDPFGAVVADVFRDEIAQGYDIRPTIAVTKAHIDMPEVHRAMAAGRLHADGRILLANGSAVVT